jgi:hypothetical protein
MNPNGPLLKRGVYRLESARVTAALPMAPVTHMQTQGRGRRVCRELPGMGD